MSKVIKKIGLIILTGFIFFASCTEIYTPKIDSGAQALVVEGLITNETGPFTIKLSKANLYNSKSTVSYITRAKLSISDNLNQTFTLTDNGNGNYITPDNFKPKIGITYTLHIETVNGNIYESKPQELMAPQSYDSIYGIHANNQYIGLDNQLKTVIGSNIVLDMFKSVAISDSFPLCRFSPTITVQYEYWEPSDSAWFWNHKCWKSIPLDDTENITEDKSHSASAYITGHFLCFTPVLMEGYGMAEPTGLVDTHFYLRINQYTINRDTYDFYTEANKQLTTSGKIFDPITSQLKGNLSCINNPSETVLGFFEVSSITRSAIVIYQNLTSPVVNVIKVPYLNITDGEIKYKQVKNGRTPEDKNGNILPDYVNITPDWWTHF